MDDGNSPTSPRKKLKSYHGTPVTMTDTMAVDKKSSPVQNPTAMNPSGGEDRLDKEARCGITQYVSPHLPGFVGVLKKRYTDFLVNEILPGGQVVHLDNLKKPPERKQPSQTASKPPVQQSSHVAQSSSAHGHNDTSRDKIQSPFKSTGLNQVEQSSRKRETVHMQHGTDGLSVVEKPIEPTAEEPNPAVKAEHELEVTPDGATEPVEIDGRHIEERGPVDTEGHRVGAPMEAGATPTEQIGNGGLPNLSGSGGGNAVGGWQAYAASRTDGANFKLSDEDRNLLDSYFNAEIVEQIIALFHRILASPLRKARDFGSVTTNPIDRDIRTQIHQTIRRIFSSKLETVTDDSGAMVVSAAGLPSKWNSRNNGGRDAGRNDRSNKLQQPKGKPGWAQLGGDYLHFTIYKENRDTMEAISHLARTLKLRPQLFQFAGTKDRRGITVQRASVYRVQIDKLIAAGKTLKQSKIGNFEYHPQGLQLGDLLGNQFLITLRDCHFQLDDYLDLENKIEQASPILSSVFENFSSNGFLNYFGLQRFGSFSTGTHTIGRSMLQGDFKSACEAILSFHPSALVAQQDSAQQDSTVIRDDVGRDDIARASAIQAFKAAGDSKRALDQLPRKFSAEACLIRHLSRSDHRNDYLGALQTINRNLRLMYVHAYQSLVWNIAATARWRAHGGRVLPGDLVLITEHPDPSTQSISDDTTTQVDQDGEPIVAAEASDRAYTTDEIFTRARPITEAELASSECPISIFDIVLPLPGYDILYPANDSANIYEEFMGSEEGGKLDPHDMRRKWKDVSLSGSYRKLLAKPLGKVEWQIKAYGAQGDDEQFVETDLDKLEKAKLGGWQQPPGPQHQGNATNGYGAKIQGPSNDAASAKTQCLNDSVPTAGSIASTSAAGPDPPSEESGQDGHTTKESGGASQPEKDIPKNEAGHSKEKDNTAPEQHGTDATSSSNKNNQVTEAPKNDKIAVILKMRLGSSTYATMALRELMKEGGVRTWKVEYGGGRR
ncbi:MAG: hypothetical protein Q9197_004571 [Variospora fuerteventurae]